MTDPASPPLAKTESALCAALDHRLLLLDGATGTMIQRLNLDESDFRGTLLEDHPVPLAGNNDLLCLTQPALIAAIHRQYLAAGADLITTNSFNANRLSQEEFGTADRVGDINLAAARIARAAADAASTPARPRFVCGSIGPTAHSAAMPVDADAPFRQSLTFDRLADVYAEQVRNLLAGGVDALLIETAYDALNVKACIEAIIREKTRSGRAVPVMISASVSGPGERLLTGQSIEAFCTAVSHAPGLLTLGLNCGLGAEQLAPVLRRLRACAPCRTSFHPNAGLPDAMGVYVQTPEILCQEVMPLLREGLAAIVGGCCGTGPEHIRALADALHEASPPPQPRPAPLTRSAFSNSENLIVPTPPHPLIRVGERTNVAGSRRFLRLMREHDLEAAIHIARGQVAAGADVIDVNMDDPLLNAAESMTPFLRAAGVEPELCRVPVMIDSSDWSVVLAGLKCLQGRGIVNSISLKDGEAVFLARAADIRRLGASALVMCFDEAGQADTLARRCEIAGRSYTLLTRAGFPARDIIIDPNVFAIATGMPEHDAMAAEFIEAVRWIKTHLPGALTSGGISNVSFAFRGNNRLRAWIHSVFLHHAEAAGLDLAIINPADAVPVDQIPPDCRTVIEDAVLNRTPDAGGRLADLAMRLTADTGTALRTPDEADTPRDPDTRLRDAVVNGDATGLADVIDAAIAGRHATGGSEAEAALSILEGPLMEGLGIVGERFSSGTVFLPQVLKSAQIMRQASEQLEPRIRRATTGASAGRARRPHLLLATVKGDVHDIGKNIVATVMRCNGWTVTDLGVMVPADRIIETAKRESADLIGLSGLITPSLEEMTHVAEAMEAEKLTVPLIVGGAAVSDLHTALKIAPAYSGVVACGGDASSMPTLCNALVRQPQARVTAARIIEKQEALRFSHSQGTTPMLSLDVARERAQARRARVRPAPAPTHPGVHRFHDIPLQTLAPLIAWPAFLAAFGFRSNRQRECNEARTLLADAQAFLNALPLPEGETLRVRGVSGIFPAGSEQETLFISVQNRVIPLTMARACGEADAGRCVVDDVLPCSEPFRDWIGLQVVCAGNGLDAIQQTLLSQHDAYHSLIAALLATRLAEAATEWVHRQTVAHYWGGEGLGIRPAPGYPACPDHALKRVIFDALDAEAATGARLTETHMMIPEASTCAFIIRGGAG